MQIKSLFLSEFMIQYSKQTGGIPMKRTKLSIIILTAVMIMFSLFGCGKPKNLDIETYKGAEPDTILVDYYDRVVGTPMEQPYEELVLYTYSDTQAMLEHYTNGGTEDEKLSRYIVPIEAAQEAFDVIRETGMDKWNSREKGMTALCGMAYVCKFPDGKGDLIRVTSDHLPEDGTRAFGEVRLAMLKYADEKYLSEKDIPKAADSPIVEDLPTEDID